MRIGSLLAMMALIGCGDKEDGGDTAGGSDDPVTRIAALDGDAGNGASVYATNCSGCHGTDGEGASAPALADISSLPAEDMISAVYNGIGSMPPFNTLSDQDIADVVAFVAEF